jgi:hypothetical protein
MVEGSHLLLRSQVGLALVCWSLMASSLVWKGWSIGSGFAYWHCGRKAIDVYILTCFSRRMLGQGLANSKCHMPAQKVLVLALCPLTEPQGPLV